LGSTNEIEELTPDSRPRELPDTPIKPLPNGLLIDVIGIVVSCCSLVVAE
jgi:hypothetical protein